MPVVADLSSEEQLRYARQILLPGWGESAQLRLKAATVFVAGAGGLGSPLALYLAAAGVGKVLIADRDRVELSNLNRQVLHGTDRVGQAKARSAERTLRALNPGIQVLGVEDTIDLEFLRREIPAADLYIDCLDNLPTRRAMNQHCLETDRPLLFGAIWGMEGRLSLLRPGRTACLCCVFPADPPAATFPVLGATAGIIGSMQAMEALKFLAGRPASLEGSLLLFDGEQMRCSRIKLRRDPQCPACGGH